MLAKKVFVHNVFGHCHVTKNHVGSQHGTVLKCEPVGLLIDLFAFIVSATMFAGWGNVYKCINLIAHLSCSLDSHTYSHKKRVPNFLNTLLMLIELAMISLLLLCNQLALITRLSMCYLFRMHLHRQSPYLR